MNLNKKEIKQIKKIFKNENLLKEAKKNFVNNRMFLILTKVSLIFQTSSSTKELFNHEKEILSNIDQIEVWSNEFKECSSFFKSPFDNCDWESFGKFIFYVWNQWKFHKKMNSIYTYENFNDINDLKSKEYNKWMNSLFETRNHNFNIYVRKILKLI